MITNYDTNFSKRLETAAAAKAHLVAKLHPKAAVTDPLLSQRQAMRDDELKAVRVARMQARADAKQAIADAQEAAVQARAALDAEALAAVRGARKERKVLSAAEAKAKRDAKYAARQARR